MGNRQGRRWETGREGDGRQAGREMGDRQGREMGDRQGRRWETGSEGDGGKDGRERGREERE